MMLTENRIKSLHGQFDTYSLANCVEFFKIDWKNSDIGFLLFLELRLKHHYKHLLVAHDNYVKHVNHAIENKELITLNTVGDKMKQCVECLFELHNWLNVKITDFRSLSFPEVIEYVTMQVKKHNKIKQQNTIPKHKDTRSLMLKEYEQHFVATSLISVNMMLISFFRHYEKVYGTPTWSVNYENHYE